MRCDTHRRPISPSFTKKRNGPCRNRAAQKGGRSEGEKEREREDYRGLRKTWEKGRGKKRKKERIVRDYRRTCAAACSSCDVTLDVLTARRVGRGR